MPELVLVFPHIQQRCKGNLECIPKADYFDYYSIGFSDNPHSHILSTPLPNTALFQSSYCTDIPAYDPFLIHIAVVRSVLPLAALLGGANYLSSISLSLIPVAIVHAIKALSPLITVLICRIFLGSRYSTSAYFSLIPLTVGVAVVSLSGGGERVARSYFGIAFAVGSTVCNVLMTIVGRHLSSEINTNQEKNPLVAKDRDGDEIQEKDGIEIVVVSDAAEQEHLGDAGSPYKLDKYNLMYYTALLGFIQILPIWLWQDGVDISVSWNTMGLFFLDGLTHFLQVILAFTALVTAASSLSFSVASLCKRIFVILAALFWYRDPVDIDRCLGICLVAVGLFLYDMSKREMQRARDHGSQSELP